MKLLLTTMLALIGASAQAYTTISNGGADAHWGPGNVPFYINFGPYDSEVNHALADWTQYTGATHLSGIDVTSGSAWFNHRNDIAWSTNEPLNFNWGNNILAICLPNYDFVSGAMIETDVVFNAAFNWSSFDGFGGNGYDVGRVLLHEIGHAIGLGHSQDGSIMNPYYQYNVWTLSSDDIAGAQHLYGKQSVPESGATVGLLTLSLVALVWAGRRV